MGSLYDNEIRVANLSPNHQPQWLINHCIHFFNRFYWPTIILPTIVLELVVNSTGVNQPAVETKGGGNRRQQGLLLLSLPFLCRCVTYTNVPSSTQPAVTSIDSSRSGSVLFCPVLSCSVLFCSVLSCPVLSCPVLSCPVLSCPVLSCPVLSCPVCLWLSVLCLYVSVSCLSVYLSVCLPVLFSLGPRAW